SLGCLQRRPYVQRRRANQDSRSSGTESRKSCDAIRTGHHDLRVFELDGAVVELPTGEQLLHDKVMVLSVVCESVRAQVEFDNGNAAIHAASSGSASVPDAG